MLCNQSPLEMFSPLPKETSHILAGLSISPLILSPWKPPFRLLFLQICIFQTLPQMESETTWPCVCLLPQTAGLQGSSNSYMYSVLF